MFRLLQDASLVSVFLSAPFLVFADTHITEDITSDTTWTKDGSPYFIDTAITIEKGVTLTIEAGVGISAGETRPIRILGSLIAHGRPDERVSFSDMATVFSFGGTLDFNYADIRNVGHFFLDEESDVKLRGSTIQIVRDAPAAFMVFGTSTLFIEDSHTSSLNSGFTQVHGGSRLLLKNSYIKGYNQRVIFAAHSTVNIEDSVMEAGQKGIEGVDADITITNSRISGTNQYAAVTYSPDFPIKARNVFWGHSSGPFHSSLNPSGLGDKVSDFVDFSPWLSSDPMVCCSSVLFLPGFEASRLYATSTEWLAENSLWEPNNDDDADALTIDGAGRSIRNVYTRVGDILDEAYVPVIGPNIYKSFMRAMDDAVATGEIAEWLPVSYDWRLSFEQLLQGGIDTGNTISYIDVAAEPYIIKEARRLAAHSKTGKITIVAHSNGGLLAKRLVDLLSDAGEGDIVDKIIFVAVPQTGSVQAVGSLVHGFKEGIPFLLSAKAIQRLGRTLPSAHVLLPSTFYAVSSPFPLIAFDYAQNLPWMDDMRSVFGSYIKDVESLNRFLEQMGLNTELLSVGVSEHNHIDTWEPPPGVLVLDVAGSGLDTLVGIRYYQGKRLGKPTLFYKPILDRNGDGTVAVWSALFGQETGTVGSMRQKTTIDLATANLAHGASWSHKDILEVPEVLGVLKSAISFKTLGSRIMPVTVPDTVITEPIQKTEVFLHADAAALEVRDNAGRRTGNAGSRVTVDIPGSNYREFGEVSYISVPKDTGDITIAVSGDKVVSGELSSITLDIESASSAPIFYSDVQITASTSVFVEMGSASSSSLPILRIDDDGDGSFDREISPDDSIAKSLVPTVSAESKREGSLDAHRNRIDSIEPKQNLPSGEIYTQATSSLGAGVVMLATSTLAPLDVPTKVSSFAGEEKDQLAAIGSIDEISIPTPLLLVIFTLGLQILYNLLISKHKGRRKRGGSKEP